GIVAGCESPAGLEVDHVDEADEVHAVLVEAVPAGALRVLAVTLAVELDLLVDDVVFARHVMHGEARGADDLVGVVELLRLRQMRDVAGVDHEGGPDRQRLHLGHRLFQGAVDVGIGGLVEAHVAVADLQEGEAAGALRLRLANDAERTRPPAADRRQDAGPGPGHALEHVAPRGAVVVVTIVIAHRVLSGWPNTGQPRRPGDAAVYSRESFPDVTRPESASCALGSYAAFASGTSSPFALGGGKSVRASGRSAGTGAAGFTGEYRRSPPAPAGV